MNIDREKLDRLTLQLKDKSLREQAFSGIVEMLSKPIYWHIRTMVLSHEAAKYIPQSMASYRFVQRRQPDTYLALQDSLQRDPYVSGSATDEKHYLVARNGRAAAQQPQSRLVLRRRRTPTPPPRGDTDTARKTTTRIQYAILRQYALRRDGCDMQQLGRSTQSIVPPRSEKNRGYLQRRRLNFRPLFRL